MTGTDEQKHKQRKRPKWYYWALAIGLRQIPIFTGMSNLVQASSLCDGSDDYTMSKRFLDMSASISECLS